MPRRTRVGGRIFAVNEGGSGNSAGLHALMYMHVLVFDDQGRSSSTL